MNPKESKWYEPMGSPMKIDYWYTNIFKPLYNGYPTDDIKSLHIKLQPQKIYFGRPPASKDEENEIGKLKDGKYIPLPVYKNGEPFYISLKHFYIEFDTSTQKFKLTTLKKRSSGWTVLLERKGKINIKNPEGVTLEDDDIIKRKNPEGVTLEDDDIIKIGDGDKNIYLNVQYKIYNL